ncbi:MAG TPA: hypothetical protein VFM25_10785 [Verrucomicrobiae bacterium]|jgi:hypothetical protein|nr:hypothetical protein [Verrucomicrobiae bacterium]
MFTAKDLQDRMTAKPFHPFKIHLSDGTEYTIENHDTAMVGRNAIEIGLNHDPDGVAEKFVRCAIIHITRIEDLQPA